jgi:hypothetical protein
VGAGPLLRLAPLWAREAAQSAQEAVTQTWEALYGFDGIRCENSEGISDHEKQEMWQRMTAHLTTGLGRGKTGHMAGDVHELADRENHIRVHRRRVLPHRGEGTNASHRRGNGSK